MLFHDFRIHPGSKLFHLLCPLTDAEGFSLAARLRKGHEGYPFYTIGQRRGLGIHLNRAVFVKELRREANEVVLAPLSSLYREDMWLTDWNLVDESRVLAPGVEVIVKIRYRKQANRCRVQLAPDGRLHVVLLDPLESIAPGQAAAFYDTDGLLLGGGIIDS